jgi:hypothetical protein
MSSIRNFQRRALEFLIKKGADKEKENLPVSLANTKFYIGETPIYLLGVSDGIGSCADMHGVDIAVFSFSPPTQQNSLPVDTCAHAALIRNLTEEERLMQPYPEVSYRVAEGLKIEKKERNYVIFALTGTKKIYTSTL